MVNEVKTIKDRRMFEKLINKFFINNSVYIKSDRGNVYVKLINSTGGMVGMRIPIPSYTPGNCLIFTRYNGNIIYGHLKFCEKKGKDVFLFNPYMFQIMSAARVENRNTFSTERGDKSLVFATNIISDFIIQKSLTHNSKTLDRIKEIIEYNNGKEYRYLKIYFCNEGMDDLRMKYFYKERTPIYIPDIRKKMTEKNATPQNIYMENIYARDNDLQKRKELISEISVPILYNKQIPYGYIQVNHNTPLAGSAFQVIKRIAIVIEELSEKHKIFQVAEEKLLVSDVSEKGLGIVFKDHRYIPYYKEKSYVCFDMLLPKRKKASIFADVRHLEMMKNNIIKVGFAIKDMDNLSSSNYNKFLSILNNP